MGAIGSSLCVSQRNTFQGCSKSAGADSIPPDSRETPPPWFFLSLPEENHNDRRAKARTSRNQHQRLDPAVKLNDQAVLVALVFFAIYDVLIGYLILRSTFLPRWLGALMVLAGLGWLTFLYEPLADRLSPYIQVLGIVAEGLLTLWLLVAGVNAERWNEQARQAPGER